MFLCPVFQQKNSTWAQNNYSLLMLCDQIEDWKESDAPTGLNVQFCTLTRAILLLEQRVLKGLSFCNISVSTSHIGNPWSQYSLGHKLIALLKLKRPPGIWMSIFSANKSISPLDSKFSNAPYIAFGSCGHTHTKTNTNKHTSTWINTCTRMCAHKKVTVSFS